MVAMNVDDLMMRAKEGLVSSDEFALVASVLRAGGRNVDVYRLAYVLGRSGAKEYENLLADFLEYRDNPNVAGLVTSILCVQWGLAGKYRDHLAAALAGYEWDDFNEVKLAALGAAGEYLRSACNCEILRALVKISESAQSNMRNFALEAMSRALGDDHLVATYPRDQVRAEAWTASVRERIATRLRDEC